MPTEAQKRAIKKYHDGQAGITIRVTKEQKERIVLAAKATGESVKDYLVIASDERIERLRPTEPPFIPPPGKLCRKSCPKHGEALVGDNVKPWCFAFGCEIPTDEQGRCRKCEECENRANK